MTRPTGKIPYKNLSTLVYRGHCRSHYRPASVFNYRGHFKFIRHTNKFIYYRFNLDKDLRLNLTLLDLHIPHTAEVVGHYCLSAYLEVQSNSYKTKHILFFCGQLASVACYPVGTILFLAMYTKPFVIVRAEMFYSVFDAYLLESITTISMKSKTAPPQWLFDFPREKKQLFIVHAKTYPVNKILVLYPTSTDTDMEAFDGPGVKSPQLKSEKLKAEKNKHSQHFFISSTFNMTVYVFRPVFGSEIITSFRALHLEVASINVQENGTLLFLPFFGSCAWKLFCLIRVKTSTACKFNLTLSNYQYKGERNLHECQYAGIWLADYYVGNTNAPWQEIYHDCVKEYAENSYQHDCFTDKTDSYHVAYDISTTKQTFLKQSSKISVFSETNEIIVAYYSFKEYGVLSLQIKVSLTKCEVIHFDICQTQSLSENIDYSNLFKISQPQIFKVLYYYYGNTLMLTGKQKCIVFQLKARKYENLKDSYSICKIHIYAPGNSLQDMYKGFSVFASGFFEGGCITFYKLQSLIAKKKNFSDKLRFVTQKMIELT